MFQDYLSPRNQLWLNGSVLVSVMDAYIEYLIKRGYSAQSVRTYSSSVAHFSYWLGKKKISIKKLNGKTTNNFLLYHLPRCHCSRRCRKNLLSVRAALKHLLIVLNKEEAPDSNHKLSHFIRDAIMHYDAYLKDVRGLTKATRINRIYYIEKFLAFKFCNRPIDIDHVTEHDFQRFIGKFAKGFKPSSIQCIASVIRCYLRYRAHLGDRTETLIATVPSVAQWRLATLPKALTQSEVKHLFSSFDRSTAIGKRDYAIARCLLDLGLRAGEVAALQINDIDWRNSTLLIKNAKSRREHQLPLPAETGKAIVDYLRHGRPEASCRSIFLRHRGPVNSAMSSGVICQRIRLASSQCSGVPRVGAHACRHTTACLMLKAGASLKSIADILRHRSLDTTTIYAKLDLDRLNYVAAPWPGELS